MDVGVIVNDDARIKHPPRIKQMLDSAHEIVGLGAPFELDEGRDVAAGAVLGL